MFRRACSIVAVLAAVAIISSCGDDASSSESVVTNASFVPATPTTAPTTTTTPFTASPLSVVSAIEGTTMAPSPSVDPALQTLVGQAHTDLATRLKIDASQIATVSAQAMSWPDGSLGCPQPGMVYTQVMVDGALIQLSVGSSTYSYHSGGSRAPFLCQKT